MSSVRESTHAAIQMIFFQKRGALCLHPIILSLTALHIIIFRTERRVEGVGGRSVLEGGGGVGVGGKWRDVIHI